VDAIEAIDQYRPEVMLIDNFVPWMKGRQAGPWAVRTVREITRLHGCNRPLRILWTTRPFVPDELTAYAFCEFGGHNVADKGRQGRRRTGDRRGRNNSRHGGRCALATAQLARYLFFGSLLIWLETVAIAAARRAVSLAAAPSTSTRA
jgi:hypothetical protein